MERSISVISSNIISFSTVSVCAANADIEGEEKGANKEMIDEEYDNAG